MSHLTEQTSPAIEAAAQAARESLIRSVAAKQPFNPAYATMVLGIGGILIDEFVQNFERQIAAQEG